jgi:hypothetical protein
MTKEYSHMSQLKSSELVGGYHCGCSELLFTTLSSGKKRRESGCWINLMLDHDVLSLILNHEIDVSHFVENLNTTLGPVLGNFSLAISQILVLYMDGVPYSNEDESWRW